MIADFVVDRQPINRGDDDATNCGDVLTQVGNGSGELVMSSISELRSRKRGGGRTRRRNFRFDGFACFLVAFRQQRVKQVEQHLFRTPVAGADSTPPGRVRPRGAR